MRIRNYLLFFFLIIFLSAVTGTNAQDADQLTVVEIDLWPEYDRPGMLVIYRMTLSPQSSLPHNMSIYIPSRAGDPHAVAARQPDGGLLNLNYDSTPANGWTEINFTATTPEVQVEFYDNMLVEGSTRSYEYEWPGVHDVESLNVQVQQPSSAENLSIVPSFGDGVVGSDGLRYFTSDIGQMRSGQTFNIEINYENPSGSISVQNLDIQPSAPLGVSDPGRSTLQSNFVWGLGLLGILFIAGGGVWYWRSGQRKNGKPETAPRRRHKPSRAKTNGIPENSLHIYCYQCGKRAQEGDRFCRSCGTRLRVQ